MGKRGEGWVVLQLILIGVISLAPPVVAVSLPAWLRLLGGGVAIAGLAVVVTGMLALGRNLSPFPKPVPNAPLVTDGIFGIVRHPLYAGAIAVVFGAGLVVSNLVVVGLAGVLFAFFDLKSRREEQWLAEEFPEYSTYRQRVSKLVPWVY